MEIVLEAKGISKSFGGVHALRQVDFTLCRGEVHALLGENGAGKSTLIKILAGAFNPDAGSLSLHAQQVKDYSPQRAAECGVATIYQETSLFPDLSVAENLFAGCQPKKRFGLVDWKFIKNRAEEVFASLGVTVPLNKKLKELGKASAQMVEIAKALSRNAEILIMDEPTAALSEADAESLFEIIRRIKAEGTAIIFISHHLEEIFKIGDRVTVLRDGCIAGTAATSEIDEKWVIERMVGKQLERGTKEKRPPPGRVVLEVNGLSRSGCFSDVSFQLREGEVLGVAGLVGAGKTELLRSIFRVDLPDAGQVTLAEKPLTGKPHENAMAGLGLVPENRALEGLVLPLPAGLNLAMVVYKRIARHGLINKSAERDLAADAYASLSIKPQNSSQLEASGFSGGNQQKLVLGKWLAAKPKVLLLDDPTQGVDVGAKTEIHRLLERLAREGMGIVLVSSDFNELAKLADRTLVMRSGKVTEELPGTAAVEEIHAAASGAGGGNAHA